MKLQLLLALVVVAGAALYLLRTIWRAWKRGAGGCSKGGCACPKPATESHIYIEKLTLRRKDQTP
jgi:hypothetical protein